MSIFDQISGRGKKKEEEQAKQDATPQQVDEDVAKARREELARRKQEAEDARIRAEESERKRLEALAKEKEQPAQAVPGFIPGSHTGAYTGAYSGGIPGIFPGVVPGQAKPAEPRIYIVLDDDYLSKIAKKVYGDAKRWPEIYEANKDIIGSNPNIIHGGQKLRIP